MVSRFNELWQLVKTRFPRRHTELSTNKLHHSKEMGIRLDTETALSLQWTDVQRGRGKDERLSYLCGKERPDDSLEARD